MQTRIVEQHDTAFDWLYQGALDHIMQKYRRSFAADVAFRPPRVAVTSARDGQIVGAAGIRCPNEGFFSQHYLDAPVSDVLSKSAGRVVAMDDVLEVGGLACASPFAAFPTLNAVFEWGRSQGIGWGLFTATAEIRRLIVRARISPLLLAPARADRVPNPSEWGTYYEHDPWVCAFQDPVQASADPVLRAETA